MIAGTVAATLLSGCASAQKPAYDTLISHRGESVDAPENTLPAFRMAVERGFGFECDIYLSTDKRLFTFHDKDLARTTDGKHKEKCVEASWEKTVSKLNVGGWGKWKGSRFDPTPPALFEEVLALARDGRLIYVEVKGNDPGWVPYIKKALESQAKATPDNVLFISFGEEVCKELKRQMPEYRVYLLVGRNKNDGSTKPADEVVKTLQELGVDGVDICFDPAVMDAAYVRKIRDAGFSFHVWTVDDLATAKLAFERGVQTVTTNCAKKLLDEYEGR